MLRIAILVTLTWKKQAKHDIKPHKTEKKNVCGVIDMLFLSISWQKIPIFKNQKCKGPLAPKCQSHMLGIAIYCN